MSKASSKYRAFRFLYPGLDAPADRAGLQLNALGSVDMVEAALSIRQAILLLVSTRPGERVRRRDYGCNIHQLLFAPNDDTTAGLAIYYVKRAIDQWEPRIEVIQLDAVRHTEDPAHLYIQLDYRIRATRQVDSLMFSFDLTRGDM